MKRPLLEGWSIALSVSDSPDLSALGLNERHLRDVVAAVARGSFSPQEPRCSTAVTSVH
jgi:hypothetical protein